MTPGDFDLRCTVAVHFAKNHFNVSSLVVAVCNFDWRSLGKVLGQPDKSEITNERAA